MKLSKLNEILTEEWNRTFLEHDSLTVSMEVFHMRLKSLGAKRLLIPLAEEQYQSEVSEAESLAKMAKFSQQNPRCVLHYNCYDRDNHEVYAIPVEIAKKIIVLGGIP